MPGNIARNISTEYHSSIKSKTVSKLGWKYTLGGYKYYSTESVMTLWRYEAWTWILWNLWRNRKKLKTDVSVCAYYQNDMKKIHHASKGRNIFPFTVTCCYFKWNVTKGSPISMSSIPCSSLISGLESEHISQPPLPLVVARWSKPEQCYLSEHVQYFRPFPNTLLRDCPPYVFFSQLSWMEKTPPNRPDPHVKYDQLLISLIPWITT